MRLRIQADGPEPKVTAGGEAIEGVELVKFTQRRGHPPSLLLGLVGDFDADLNADVPSSPAEAEPPKRSRPML